jgi:hypothetical protein
LSPRREKLEEQAHDIDKANRIGIDGDENQGQLELEDHEMCIFDFCESCNGTSLEFNNATSVR